MTWKERYREAHYEWYCVNRAAVVDAGHYPQPNYPDVRTHGGLLTFIDNFLNWSGHASTRITTAGRLIDKAEKQPSGAIITTKRRIKSMTRKGTGDIISSIFGITCWFDGKVGRDKPSQYQLAEQEKQRRAKANYEFIHSPEELLDWYDNFVSSIPKQTTPS